MVIKLHTLTNDQNYSLYFTSLSEKLNALLHTALTTIRLKLLETKISQWSNCPHESLERKIRLPRNPCCILSLLHHNYFILCLQERIRPFKFSISANRSFLVLFGFVPDSWFFTIEFWGKIVHWTNLILSFVNNVSLFHVRVPFRDVFQFFEKMPYLIKRSVNFDKKREQNHDF